MRSLRKWFSGRRSGGIVARQTKSLVACSSIWGDSLVMENSPRMEAYYAVSVLPCAQHVGLRDDLGWGVFDSDRNLIDAAALKIGAGIGLVGQCSTMPYSAESSWDFRTGENYIYGGSINAHFGHFICSSLSRLWWLAANQDTVSKRIIFHSPSDFSTVMVHDFIATCFKGLGISESNSVVITRPTKFERLVVPGPSLEEQSFVHGDYRRVCHKIGRPFWDVSTKRTSYPPAYISKSKLTHGINRVNNESIIEEIMSSRGAEIIYPERLSFSEQVRLFSQNRVIVGMAGSAFHTSIFAPPNSKIICLVPGGVLNANMCLIDKVNNNRSSYYVPVEGFIGEGSNSGFHENLKVVGIEAVATDLADLAFS